jgi:hypothetical protein
MCSKKVFARTQFVPEYAYFIVNGKKSRVIITSDCADIPGKTWERVKKLALAQLLLHAGYQILLRIERKKS